MSTFNLSLDDGEISDLLNENFDDVDEQYEKTENIVTNIVAQNIGGEIFTGKSVNRLILNLELIVFSFYCRYMLCSSYVSFSSNL